MKRRFAVCILLASFITGCGGSNVPIGESDAEKEARDKAADQDQTPLKSCSSKDMDALRFTSVAHVDEAAICSTMESSLGHIPSIALVRHMAKAVFAYEVKGDKDSAQELTYQMMNIVEARGQQSNDAAIEESMETIFKIFNGTQGHVTPSDMNVALRNPSVHPRSLDEQEMFTLGAMVWEAKKANGG